MRRLKSMFVFLLLLLSACSHSSKIEGTWYSAVDETMYNFSEGEIRVSGVVVGQYEDNSDSVVISLVSDSTNLKLYTTTMDGVEVLADVKEGEGKVFFVRGLENAKAFVQKNKTQEYHDYIKENIYGTWDFISPNSPYDTIVIREDGTFLAYKDDAMGMLYWINLAIGTADDELCAFLTMAENKDGINEWDLIIYPTDDTYEDDVLQFGEYRAQKSD